MKSLCNEKKRDAQECMRSFGQKYDLELMQQEQFFRYSEMLRSWNDIMNLTAILDPERVILEHFQDSLSLGDAKDMSHVKGVIDVGSGGGFPGIPLKIKWPHLTVILVEVNNKKREFLRAVIQELGLNNIEISDYDWKTFVRKTSYQVDIVCARASLRPDDLIFMFKPISAYKDCLLVYWAAAGWVPEPAAIVPYCERQFEYNVGNKKRKLIFLRRI